MQTNTTKKPRILQRLSDGSRNTKPMSTRKMREYYQSEEFDKHQSEACRQAKETKNFKDGVKMFKDVKAEAELHGSSLSAIQQKEVYRSRIGFKILVVDDNDDVRDTIVDFLKEECGFLNIDQADSAAQALRLCTEKQYDLVLSDFNMPEMNGYNLYRQLTDSDYGATFVMVTGYDSNQFNHLKKAGVLCLPKVGAVDLLDNLKKVTVGYYLRTLDKAIKKEIV